MAQDAFSEHSLFGGAISTTFPDRFQDLSNVRQVPDHQEAFSEPDRDESIIVQLLDLKHEVTDENSAAWFLQDLATEQDAEGGMHGSLCKEENTQSTIAAAVRVGTGGLYQFRHQCAILFMQNIYCLRERR